MDAMDADDEQNGLPSGKRSPAPAHPLSSRARAHVHDLLLAHQQLIDTHQQLILQQQQLMLQHSQMVSLLMDEGEGPDDEDSSGQPSTFLNGRPIGD